MASNDYHVIVYKILAYLYDGLKAGEPVDKSLLTADGHFFGVPESYWAFIWQSLLDAGYVNGIVITRAFGSTSIIQGLESAQITPLGIEYLSDNAFLQKVKRFLQDAKAAIPFV